jgi:hypothetical protein
MLILGLLGMYFDAAVVFVIKSSLLFSLAVAILCRLKVFCCYQLGQKKFGVCFDFEENKMGTTPTVFAQKLEQTPMCVQEQKALLNICHFFSLARPQCSHS